MDHINLFPNHLLVEMFGNLSPGMIKSCCLVCKRWNEIIGTSPKLMKRFQLNVKKPLEAMEMQRKYQSAIIECSKSLDVIVHHNYNLKSLKLTKIKQIKLSTWVKALNELSTLKDVNVGYMDFIDDLSIFRDNIKTIGTNIEQLECTVNIIHTFSCCTVKKLELSCGLNIDENKKLLAINFLKKQNNLEDLCLVGEAFGEFYAQPDFINHKFSLKVFKYHNGPDLFPHYESFIRFLSQSIRSLTSLEVEFSTEPDFGLQEIYKYALENIVHLKHIGMDFFNGEFFLNELPAATNITKNLESLKICGLSLDSNLDESFFDMLPNLKYLNFRGTDNSEADLELFHCISKRCPKIEILRKFCLYGDVPGIVYFPKLKEVILELYDDDDYFCDFVNQHSQTLERITIDDLYFDDDTRSFTPSFTKAILNCPKLNYLRLNIDKLTFGLTIMIGDIASKYKQFTLVLPKHKFVFPDDAAIFHDSEV